MQKKEIGEMKTNFNKMFWGIRGWDIEIGIDITRWLIGFGWDCKYPYAHINFGPMVICFSKGIGK